MGTFIIYYCIIWIVAAVCEAPLYNSDTGLPLCHPVPPGTYWTSPTTYTPCPNNSTTLGIQGAEDITGCRGELLYVQRYMLSYLLMN